jgi:DHA2 family multidrug resistance protein
LLSLLRNEGGSVGTSLAQTMQERRDQFHTLRLGESLDPFNAAVSAFLEQARGIFLQQTGDPVAAQQLALQALENASIGTCLFRCLSDVCRGDADATFSG